MKRLLVYFSVLLLSVEALFTSSSNSLILTQQNFDSALSNPALPYFIKVYAPWCGFCKKLAPTWQELAQDLKDKVNFAVLDGIEERGLAHRFQINGFPSLFFTQDGINFLFYDGDREYDDLKQFVLYGYKRIPEDKWIQLKEDPSVLSLLYEDFEETMIQADKKLDQFFIDKGWGVPSETQKVLAVVIPSVFIIGLMMVGFVRSIRRMQEVTEEKKNQ